MASGKTIEVSRWVTSYTENSTRTYYKYDFTNNTSGKYWYYKGTDNTNKFDFTYTADNKLIELEENEVVFLLLSFSDLSHHRTCGSAYGGSYFGYHSRYEPINVA